MGDGAVFRSVDGMRLELKPRVVAQLRVHAQVQPKAPESGGILIGRRIAGSVDAVVDLATEPFPSDRRSRFRFTRLPTGHQAVLDREWVSSTEVETYLGEWHTHASSDVSPSTCDHRNWRRLQSRSGDSRLYFLIVGTETIGCWSDGVMWALEGE